MELGSAQHKQLLLKGLLKVAFKTTLLGLSIGLVFMVPYFIRDNLFSTGLFYMGTVIVFISLIYSVTLAYKKYQRLIKNFS